VALKRLRLGQLALVFLASFLVAVAPRLSVILFNPPQPRFTVGAAGFFILSQSGERPER
jgi:hypothetical protein